MSRPIVSPPGPEALSFCHLELGLQSWHYSGFRAGLKKNREKMNQRSVLGEGLGGVFVPIKGLRRILTDQITIPRNIF